MKQAPKQLRSKWVEALAIGVVALSAAEEMRYARHRLASRTRSWWEEKEHQERYGIERSLLESLAPLILTHRLRHADTKSPGPVTYIG